MKYVGSNLYNRVEVDIRASNMNELCIGDLVLSPDGPIAIDPNESLRDLNGNLCIEPA